MKGVHRAWGFLERNQTTTSVDWFVTTCHDTWNLCVSHGQYAVRSRAAQQASTHSQQCVSLQVRLSSADVASQALSRYTCGSDALACHKHHYRPDDASVNGCHPGDLPVAPSPSAQFGHHQVTALRACHTALYPSWKSGRSLHQSRSYCTPSAAQTEAPPWPPKPVHWIETRVPPSILPYVHLARMHKPIGSWLLAWPCMWSIALATPAGSFPDVYMMMLFGTGAMLLRGAGCTINDMWDRDFDSQVERTKYRPLAARVINLQQATAFLAAQLSLGLVILLQLNDYSKLLGASSLLLVGSYPLMKRITSWPQAYLGLAMNWGALLGWAAVRGSCDWGVVLPLYLSGVAWTLVYDTIYAHMDKHDDVKAGIKSTALLFGGHTKPALVGFTSAACALQLASGYAAGVGPAYYGGVGLSTAHLAWQISSVNLDNRDDCLAKFKSNVSYGGLLTGGILADKLLLWLHVMS